MFAKENPITKSNKNILDMQNYFFESLKLKSVKFNQLNFFCLIFSRYTLKIRLKIFGLEMTAS